MIKNNQKLRDSAIRLTQAKKDYKQSFEVLCEGVESLSEMKFWVILNTYRKLVLEYQKNREYPTEAAARELFRVCVCGDSNFTMDELVAFAVTYQRKVKALYKPMFDKSKDRSDDGYSDLLDSVILAGENFYKDALAGKLYDVDENLPEYVKAVRLPHRMNEFILQGENYNGLYLSEAAEKYVRVYINDLEREKKEKARKVA